MVIPFHHTIQIILVVLGGALFACLLAHRYTIGSRARNTVAKLLGLVVLLSLFGYGRFGDFHPYNTGVNRAYHYPDAFHYYFGAKYFGEFGYYRIYEDTLVAFAELSQEGVHVPFVANVRDLVGQEQLTPNTEIFARQAELKAHFTPERWQEFKQDLKTFLSFPMGDSPWYQILGDMGFNPPPTWNVTANLVARAIPLTETTFSAIGFIDIALVLGLGGWFVWLAFGGFGLAGYLIVFSNNWIGSYDWVGGSFLREAWLAFVVCGLCSLKLERYAVAGGFLCAAALDRVWPGLFLFGAGLPLAFAWLRRTGPLRPLLEMTGGVLAVALPLIALSLWMFPVSYWDEFFAKLWKHNHTYFAMHLGFQKLAVWSALGSGPPMWAGDGYVAWQQQIAAYYREHEALVTLVKTLFIGSAPLPALRLKPWTAALLVGATGLYFAAMPANYYYAYLAVFAPILYQECPTQTDIARLLGLFALLLGFLLAPVCWPDTLTYNAYINLLILLFLFLLHGTFIADQSRTLVSWLQSLSGRQPTTDTTLQGTIQETIDETDLELSSTNQTPSP